ncbi:hypothetical protein KP509_02G034700 [Ceratopteris richardii]|uniref:Terpene synthase n=1 Tax=Ceratopteris richardii TaxID=49495 RepID=A0A8T2VG42_CERRI|nr:hypothetical protein KP509_02G034700 [Ceratopteris richardii]
MHLSTNRLNSAGTAMAPCLNGELMSQEKLLPWQLDLLWETHNIVIPPIPCSFPTRNHPDCEMLTEFSDAWVSQNFTDVHGANVHPSSFAPEHIRKSAFPMLTTLVYPDGIGERMQPTIKLMIWLFLIDDILDNRIEMNGDPDLAKKEVDSLFKVFQDGYLDLSSASGLVRILMYTAAEWWSELCQDMPPKQIARLAKTFFDYLAATRKQNSYCESRRVPDMETYLQIRNHAGGWWPFAVMIEYCNGFELDEEALSHPLMLDLLKNTVEHICIANDVISFKKEYVQGGFCNTVLVLYFQKLYDSKRDLGRPAPTLQCAISEAIEMVRQRDENCVKLMKQVRNCNELMNKPGMEEYLQGLGLWMSGSIYWHIVTQRYGIRATREDLHEIPPNMFISHQVKIDVNKEAAPYAPNEEILSAIRPS